jgi:hypothetical protein
VAIVALSIAFVSADASLWAAGTPDCCANGMCPMMQQMMHHGAGVYCNMDMSHPAGQLQTCPTPASRFTSAMVFVRVAPLALVTGQRAGERLPFSALPAVPAADLEVSAPPPRTFLA